MRRLILATLLAGICFWGCSRPRAAPVAGSKHSPAENQGAGTRYGDYVIGARVSHENLTIFPISTTTPKNDDRFITLDEGLAAGSVKLIEVGADLRSVSSDADATPIDEQPQQSANQEFPASDLAVDRSQDGSEVPSADDPFGPAPKESQQEATRATEENVQAADNPFGGTEDGADVNTLMVLNTSGKPLYLMPGEVISGGNQDRTIGQELVIASSNKPIAIDVFCVEHGRWAGRDVEHTTSQLSAAAEISQNLAFSASQPVLIEGLAKESQQGKFVASVGQLNKDARLAVQEAGDQEKVWEEVGKTNSKVKNVSESGNFSENYFSREVAKDFEPFIKKLKPTAETKQIVGVAVAVNGKMLSVDVFESTPLFKKFWPKLLKSYALDAVAAEGDVNPRENQQAVSVDDCIAFLKNVEKAKAKTEELDDGQKIAIRQSPRGTSFSYYDVKAASAAGVTHEGGAMGGGGFGGGVHTSVLAK